MLSPGNKHVQKSWRLRDLLIRGSLERSTIFGMWTVALVQGRSESNIPRKAFLNRGTIFDVIRSHAGAFLLLSRASLSVAIHMPWPTRERQVKSSSSTTTHQLLTHIPFTSFSYPDHNTNISPILCPDTPPQRAYHIISLPTSFS